ncbi:MAG: CPBP family intramembrane metalloprotease [Bacteroidota bacterium]|nr:CPBP family intramembrane metalloprotease [Bacteroidota bacterium]MDP4212800.1 CPBP family intramembrane metalloprotease [Bacteroidota bacterium]MDP4250224.1 CPBP family intramembrane metalloprotease [Bacteroidota bacterium]
MHSQFGIGNKPAWMQLIIFGGLVGIILFLTLGLGISIVARVNDLTVRQIASMRPEDYARPELAGVVRGLLVVQSIGLFILPSLFFAFLADSRPFAFAGLKAPDKKSFIFWGVIIIVAAFFMVEWLALINQELVTHLLTKSARDWVEKGESDTDNTLKNILTLKSTGDLLESVLLVGVLAAVGEELFFRGILQRLFIQIFKSAWPGIIFTAALFSAFHGQFMGFIPRMILGIILGALYWYSGSIIPAMIGHFIFNSGQLLLVYFKVVDLESTSNANTLTTVLGVASLLLVIFLLNYMRKHSQTTYSGMFPEAAEDASRGVDG